MEPFRSVRGGGVKAVLAASEAELLRNLVAQLMDLIEPESARAADLDELEMLLQAEATSTPTDPVLARLLPDGYRDDPDSAGEFRKYTELSLRAAKHESAQAMLGSLPEQGGKLHLNADQAQAWLKSLNDVRLALGTKLGVTEDFEDQWDKLGQDDPRRTAFEVYAWLGAVQESLVRALW
ncbi:MAG TPA: DUF2017 domain-containing protein [Streptosporangiaceae bacterium]